MSGQSLAALLLLALLSTLSASGAERWLLVDTGDLTLTVYEADRPLLTLHNLSIGRFGAGGAKRRGDNTTPLGRFRITGLERNSRFHHFIGLDYPDPARADQAHRDGLITHAQHQAILTAHREESIPPQDTPLGGHIGIHGLGQADPRVHETMNWTRGCVALTNQQVETLFDWVHVGMLVEVR